MAAKTAKKTVKSSSKQIVASKNKPASGRAAQTVKKAAAAKVVSPKKTTSNSVPQKRQICKKTPKTTSAKDFVKKAAPKSAPKKAESKKSLSQKAQIKNKKSKQTQKKSAVKSKVLQSGKTSAKKTGSANSAKGKTRTKPAVNPVKKAQVKPIAGRSALTENKIVKKDGKKILKKVASSAVKSAKTPKSKADSKHSSATKTAEAKKNTQVKTPKKTAVSAKKNQAQSYASPKAAKREEKVASPSMSKQVKPEAKYRETIDDLPVKKRGKNHVRSSESIAFTIEDLDAYLERKENGNPISITKEIAISKKKRGQAVKSPVAAPKPDAKKPSAPSVRKPLEPASIFDILGFNPVEVPTREKLEEKDVPRKWKKYYNLLIDLRKHHSAGVEKRSEEVLKRSVKEDSGDLSSYGQHLADAGSESFERDMTYNILSNEKETLAEIDEAIKRIKNGTYGICEVTGMPIPDERLSAIPFTRYTKEGQERKELEQKRIKATQRNLYDIPENGVGGEDDSSVQ